MPRRFWKIILLAFCAVFCSTGSSVAQINALFHSSTYPVPIFRKINDVEFKWTMSKSAAGSIRRGIANLKLEKFKESIASLDSVIKEDDGLWMAYYYRAQAKRSNHDNYGALADLQKVLKLNPTLNIIYLELGKMYLVVGRSITADSLFDLSLKANPEIIGPLFYQSLIESHRYNIMKARRLINKTLELDPRNSRAYIVRGVMFLPSKPGMRHLEDFNLAIEADPDDYYAYMSRGFIYIKMKKFPEALYDWDKMVLLGGNNAEHLLLRAKLKILMHNYNGAFQDITLAFESTPVSEDEYTGGQNLLESQTGFQSAGRYLLNNSRSLNQEVLVDLKRAYGEMVSGEYTHSLRTILHAERIQPSATMWYMKGLVCDKLREYDSALRYYDLALKLDNNIYEAHKRRGYYRSVIGDSKGAFEDLNEMKRIMPGSYSVFRLSGEIKYSLHDYYGAILDLTKFLKHDSANTEVLIIRSTCRSRVLDYAGANSDLEKVIVADSTIDVYNDMFINCLQAKDTLGAKDILIRASLHHTMTFADYVAIADAYYLVKDWTALEAACKTARGFLKNTPNQYFVSSTHLAVRLTYLDVLVAFHAKRYEDCIRDASWVVRNDPAFKMEMMYYRGLSHLALGENRKAKLDLEEPAQAFFADAKKHFDSIKSW